MLSKEPGTTSKKLVTQKIEVYTKLMINFLHIEDNKFDTSEHVETEDLTPIEFVRQVEKSDVTEEDMEDYENYIEDTVRISSPIYQQCKLALLTMAAYVYDKEQDEEFADWIEKYANEVYSFSKDQKVNYDQMKSAFLRDLQKKGVA